MAKKTKPETTTGSSYPKLIDTRLQQLHFTLEDQKAEALVITHLPNIRYLTNFSGSSAILFITNNEIHFITDDRYEEQIKTELYQLNNLKTYISRDPWKTAVTEGILRKVQTLAFEADKTFYSAAVEIRNKIRPIKFKPVDDLMERFTVPKSPEEVEYIQQACDIAVKTYEHILTFIKPGISEKDIELEIAYHSRQLGSEGDAFPIIVVSGTRGALVHGAASLKKIKVGDVIIMDFGCVVNGFRSDITRTVAVGKATKEQKTIYKMLVNAKDSAIAITRPSMNGKTVDHAARSIIEKEGLGEYFQHSLGHGIGLVDHEKPIITFRMDDQTIPEGCVLAIEPGVYIPDKFGMRVEDCIHVGRNGCKYLTRAPEEIPVIG
jgi:Xaa-Pro aminopeptidase